MYLLIKSIAAKFRPILAPGAFVVFSDVSHALNLGSHQQRCDSTVLAATMGDLSCSSLVIKPLGLSWGFTISSGQIFFHGELSAPSWDSGAGLGTC